MVGHRVRRFWGLTMIRRSVRGGQCWRWGWDDSSAVLGAGEHAAVGGEGSGEFRVGGGLGLGYEGEVWGEVSSRPEKAVVLGGAREPLLPLSLISRLGQLQDALELFAQT